MLLVLPASVFVFLLLGFRARSATRSWREALVAAALVLGVSTILSTEGLSQLRLIAQPGIASFWAVALVGAVVFWRVALKRAPAAATAVPHESGWWPRLLLAGLAVYVATTAVIAFVAPPNTWDSMEYHLPKVMHWIQNGSVSFYPTAIPRQNHLGPGAEFALLHLHLLSGSDRWANFVEWLAMVGSLAAVSLIARQLGAGAVGQRLAAMFAATLPMGIMQASSTQTDFVAAFWLSCFVYFLLRLRADRALPWPWLIGVSVSLALAVFTKATSYLVAAAFLPWLAVVLVQAPRRRALLAAATLVAIFVSLNAGHYARNLALYRHPLGPREEPMQNTKYGLESRVPAALASNFSKHIATHLVTPWPAVSAAIERAYAAFHRKIGWELNDPRTSWGAPRGRFSIRRIAFHDEADGNPVHFLLGGIALLLAVGLPSLRRDRALLAYAAALVVGFLCFAFYLKWHPWMSRLHLPWFVLLAPFVAIVLGRISSRALVPGAAVLLWALGLPWLLFCTQRPLIAEANLFNTTRDRLTYKTPRQAYEAPFAEARAFLAARKVSQLGLIVGNSSWEYPWWVYLRADHPQARIEHVNVSDASGALAATPPFSEFKPEALLTLDQRPQPEQISVGSLVYAKRWAQAQVAIYLPD
jgi:hypothetical protein